MNTFFRHGITAIVLDEGTSEEKLYMGGGSSSDQAIEMATIVATYGNSAGYAKWDNSHPRLIDNKGISGVTQEHDLFCAISRQGSGKRAFLSMELEAPQKVVRVQLAFRSDGLYPSNGKNVRVQVGSSPQYEANDPVCIDIGQLTGTGLVDYHCDKLHVGQYVILSNDQDLLICEARVFVEMYIEDPNEDFTAMYNSSSKSWRLSFC